MELTCPQPTELHTSLPRILTQRERGKTENEFLKNRLDKLIPQFMDEEGIDMWIMPCHEDQVDPMVQLLVPFMNWHPLLGIMMFGRQGDVVKRWFLSPMVHSGFFPEEDRMAMRDSDGVWQRMAEIVEELNPRNIAINTSSTIWAASGLSHTLYVDLMNALPGGSREKVISSEPLVIKVGATLLDEEIEWYEHVTHVAHHLIAQCMSRDVINVGVTTTEDLEWHYQQIASDLGFTRSFMPYFNVFRSDEGKEQFGDSKVIQGGDMLHCDVGIKYLRLNSDHQRVAYVLKENETKAPSCIQAAWAPMTRLQDIFMETFKAGLSGNEIHARIMEKARSEGIDPKVYSHSLGFFLHEPGPLIGLPWAQEGVPGRGDVVLGNNMAFTMETSVFIDAPEWSKEPFRLPTEEDVVFTKGQCRVMDGRQTEFMLI